MTQLLSAIELASIMALPTLAALLTFRMAGFPDLSVDGVFALGAAIFARCYWAGMGVIPSLLAAVAGGMVAGAVTGLLAQKLRIHPLLASVLVLTVLYTVNLRVLGRPNLPLMSLADQRTGVWSNGLLTSSSAAIATLALAFFFFRSELGTAMRMTGRSPAFLQSVARNPAVYRVVLVVIASGLVALAGCLLALRHRYADVYFGNGVIIVAIASLIVGEKLCSRRFYWTQMLAIPIGSLVYQMAATIALAVGLAPVDVKLATGVATIALIAIGAGREDDLLADTH